MVIPSGLRNGLTTAIVSVFLILIGVTTLMGTLLGEWFGLTSKSVGAWLLLLFVAFMAGVRAVKSARCAGWGDAMLAGLAAGVAHAAPMGLFIGLLGALMAAKTDVRQWLVQIHEASVSMFTAGRTPVTAGLVIALALLAAALAGAVWTKLRAGPAIMGTLRSAWDGAQRGLLNLPAGRAVGASPKTRIVILAVALLVVLAAPFVLNQYWNYTLGTVGIYVLLGLGLNIIVGMSGLLVLGYAAFFAVGAYTMAILTAPAPHNIMLSFWVVLPISVVLACFAALLLGLPVLRMRGDYLAIVTLGFGEIIRILVRSEMMDTFTGGPRGIRAVGHPMLFGKDIGTEFYFMYIILIAIFLAIFITRRLENSRVGRAWRAMREDETVAQAMGVYMLKYKLLAFATGAAFAGLGGAIFASRNSFTGPEDFTLLVSINVLALLIVGGLNSVPGIILGAVVLKGLPEILRQLEDYRILAFGALLVVMMIVRPQGLWPSSRAMLERPKKVEPPAEVCEVKPQGGAA